MTERDSQSIFMCAPFVDFLRAFNETVAEHYYGPGDFADRYQDAILLAFEALPPEWRDDLVLCKEAGKAFGHQLANLYQLQSRDTP